MLMSPSALPLHNTNKLIYKSGFFNKFKETLPIVSWLLRKEEKGARRWPGSGESGKHRRTQAEWVTALVCLHEGGEDLARGPGARPGWSLPKPNHCSQGEQTPVTRTGTHALTLGSALRPRGSPVAGGQPASVALTGLRRRGGRPLGAGPRRLQASALHLH